MPSLAKKCIKSWRKYCPDFEIIRWDESNFDYKSNAYAKEAYETGKWAFVSDYVRLKTVYEQGGIYLDTDVELIKPIDALLENKGFMGFDEKGLMSTGLGFGAEAGCAVIGEILADYENLHFKTDGGLDLTPCPDRNTAVLEKLGMDIKNTNQTFMGVRFLPHDYLCPMDFYTGKITLTENTYSIHRYCASWLSPISKRTTRIKRIIGVKMYDKLYGKFLHKFKWLEW